ncbi:MAG: hypothetical protein V1495_07995 [Pseudomonadota bacterium]
MKGWLTEHPVMKIVSLILATLLWAFVRGERRMETSIEVPVQVQNLPEKFMIIGEIDPSINLRLSGPKSRLGRLDPATFPPYELDLKNAHRGSNTFFIREGAFKVPYGITVMRVVPPSIRVVVDEAEEKLVRIEPRFVDDPDEGYEVESYEVKPAYTKKRGSRKDLAVTPYIFTEPISLAGRHGSFSGEYSLTSATPGSDEEKKVTLRVVVKEKELSKMFREVPVRVTGFTSAVKVEPRTVSIRARGPAGKVTAFGEEHLEIEIDALKLGLGKTRQRVVHVTARPLKHPGLELTVVPDTVRVTLLAE